MKRDYFKTKERNPNFPDPENNKIDRILVDVPNYYDPSQLTEEQKIAMQIRDAERSEYNIMKAAENLGRSEEEIRADLKRQSDSVARQLSNTHAHGISNPNNLTETERQAKRLVEFTSLINPKRRLNTR